MNVHNSARDLSQAADLRLIPIVPRLSLTKQPSQARPKDFKPSHSNQALLRLQSNFCLKEHPICPCLGVVIYLPLSTRLPCMLSELRGPQQAGDDPSARLRISPHEVGDFPFQIAK
eukprot:4150297-Amphidinium_carterae.1